MAIITQPMIDNLVVSVVRDVANAEITVSYDINWSDFDQLTDLVYNEAWSIVGVDSGGTTTLYTGPILVSGVSSNGASSVHRTKVATIPWGDLDEDTAGNDEIAAVVTLTPKLPTLKTAQSPQVVVTSP